ncbi:pentapeptide repeat-containing protein [Bacillus haynesii]|uniref:pentapeptide repeat-containing protein n=1 Tax=Bacillus haynesii TaxID=1925021 RepID=UPI00399040EE
MEENITVYLWCTTRYNSQSILKFYINNSGIQQIAVFTPSNCNLRHFQYFVLFNLFFLTCVSLICVSLICVSLTCASLTYASLTCASLTYASLTYASLTYASLTYASLTCATIIIVKIIIFNSVIYVYSDIQNIFIYNI